MLRGRVCFSLIYVISFRLLEIPINVPFFQFVAIEGVVTAVVDLFPRFLRRGYRKELFTAFVCVIWFLIGLSMVTEVIILTYSDSLLRQILTSTVLDQCGEAGYQQNIVKKKKMQIAFPPTKHLGVLMNSFKRVRAFQIELEFGSVGV